MLANRTFFVTLLKRKSFCHLNQVASSSRAGEWHDERVAIGKREWVGYGIMSPPNYVDRVDYPMPAVRFRETTDEIAALREKEKSDWKKLTIEEKKKLYRASFRQTFAEVYAPTGQWKSIAGWSFFFMGVGLWLFILMKKYVLPPLPPTFSEEHRQLMFRHMLVNKAGHLSGYASKWDYEKDDWKK